MLFLTLLLDAILAVYKGKKKAYSTQKTFLSITFQFSTSQNPSWRDDLDGCTKAIKKNHALCKGLFY